MDVIATVFPLIFTSSFLMSIVKMIAQGSVSKPWLRAFLALFAIMGILVSLALTGDPINMDSIMSLTKALSEAIVVAVGAHFFYKAIKES